MTKIAVAGATGYGGIELVRILSCHPQVELVCLTSEHYAGKQIGEVLPQLSGVKRPLVSMDDWQQAGQAEVAFLALPNGHAMKLAPGLLAAGKRVLDLSADFRFRDPAVYSQWYRTEHASAQLLPESVYGLPELYREEIRSARLVGCPGCYPTSAILALAPLVKAGLVQPETMVIDSKSGVSGAGRTSLTLPYHFPETNEDVSAYGLAGHRHLPEMEEHLGRLAGREIRVTFTPHLVPLTRGVLTTAYGAAPAGTTGEQLQAALRDFYRDQPFVRVMEGDLLPHTKYAVGSNYCYLAARMDSRTGRAISISALDNLGKGMASQAVQCMNLMLGLEETTGLEGAGVYP